MLNPNYKISTVDVKKRQALDLRPGDTVRVFQKIKEKGKIRLQVFEGLVIARKHGTEAGATFTVRKVASGVGMEKIFPLYSPNIDKIEITKRSQVKRAKLYYIRDKATKEIRKKMRSTMMVAAPVEVETEEVVEATPVAEEQVAE
jgi:large subunit ribosomal protein L19